MKVLLKEDVEKLGSVGDEVEVKPGFARNYLIPTGKAILATTKNVKQLNHQKAIVQRKLKKLKGEAEDVAAKINALVLTVTKKVGDQGKLFGSVTSQEIAELASGQGVEIDRRKILLAEPIKSLGEFKIDVKLHPEVTAQISLTVAAEAPAQAPSENPTPEAPAEPTESA